MCNNGLAYTFFSFGEQIMKIKDKIIAEIKKVYRNLARKNHPDIVRAKGITDKSLIQKAKENFQRINDAYEQILKIRGEK